MLKKVIIVGISIMSVVFAGVAFAENNGAETMVLQGGKSGDVTFHHKAHQEKLHQECDACHTLFAKEAGSIEKAIAAGTMKKKDAMKQCVACHKAEKAKNAAAGPIKCKECHKK